jgi:hypothetical protein
MFQTALGILDNLATSWRELLLARIFVKMNLSVNTPANERLNFVAAMVKA